MPELEGFGEGPPAEWPHVGIRRRRETSHGSSPCVLNKADHDGAPRSMAIVSWLRANRTTADRSDRRNDRHTSGDWRQPGRLRNRRRPPRPSAVPEPRSEALRGSRLVQSLQQLLGRDATVGLIDDLDDLAPIGIGPVETHADPASSADIGRDEESSTFGKRVRSNSPIWPSGRFDETSNRSLARRLRYVRMVLTIREGSMSGGEQSGGWAPRPGSANPSRWIATHIASAELLLPTGGVLTNNGGRHKRGWNRCR